MPALLSLCNALQQENIPEGFVPPASVVITTCQYREGVYILGRDSCTFQGEGRTFWSGAVVTSWGGVPWGVYLTRGWVYLLGVGCTFQGAFQNGTGTRHTKPSEEIWDQAYPP